MSKISKHIVNGRPCEQINCWCRCKSVFHQEVDDYGFFAEDVVNHPKHYQLDGLEVEALDVIKSALSEEEFKGYLLGNMLKYMLRHKKKNNEEDLQKMLFYSKELDKLL